MPRSLLAGAMRPVLLVGALVALALVVRPTVGFAPAPAGADAAGLGPIVQFSTIKWKVVDQLGIPVGGARFVVDAPGQFGVLVDDDGQRDLDDRPGRLQFSVAASGRFDTCPLLAPTGYYYPAGSASCQEAIVGAGDTKTLEDVTVIAFKTARWQVREPDGDLVGGATFHLEGPTEVHVGPDPDGRYHANGLVHGDYELCMTAAPFGYVGTGCRSFTIASLIKVHDVAPDFKVARLVLPTPAPTPTSTPTPEPTDEPDEPDPTDPPAPAPTAEPEPTKKPQATPAPTPVPVATPAGSTGTAEGGTAGSPDPSTIAGASLPPSSVASGVPTGAPTGAAASIEGAPSSAPAAQSGAESGAGTESTSGPAGPSAVVLLGGVIALGLLALVVAVLLRRRAAARPPAAA